MSEKANREVECQDIEYMEWWGAGEGGVVGWMLKNWER